MTILLCLVRDVRRGAALLWIFGCAAPPPGNVVRVGTDVDAETLDPRLTRNTTGYRVVNLVYDGLVELDENLQLVAGLAESWDNPTPTTWVFNLRNGARFHDGTPLTADDVVYTFETILDPALGAPMRRLYTPIESIEARDDATVVVTLSEPYAPFLSYLDMGIVPRHLAESGHDLNASPVGTGPYRMTRWDKGSRIVLEANGDYWGGGPQLERVDIILVPDNTARAQAFEAGDLDVIQSPLGPQDVRQLEADARFESAIEPGTAITYFNFNTAVPRLSDPRVRRALSMLIDQKTIIRQIYEDMDQAAFSMLPPTSWAYSSDIRQPTYDPESAERLLAEAGWRDTDGDGVLDREGEKLSITFGTHSEDVNRIQTLEFLQHTFAQRGIEARLEISDWPSFSVRRDAGDYEIILLGWTQIIDPDRVMFEQLHSEGGLNWGSYANERMDELLEEGRATEDREQRAGIYRDASRIIAEEVPYYILSYQGFQFFHHPRVQGIRPNPRGLLRSLTTASVRNRQ